MRRCAIISPDKVFHPPACGGGLVSSPPSAMPVISQDTRRTTAKQARTMIGLRGQRCRTASANGIVYRYRSIGLRRRRWRVCSVCCVTVRPPTKNAFWEAPEDESEDTQSTIDQTTTRAVQCNHLSLATHTSPSSCPNVAAGRQSGDGPLSPERQMPRRRLPSSQPASADRRRLEGLAIIIG